MWIIELYKTDQGREVVAEFFDGLPRKLKAKTFWEIDLLSVHGPALQQPYVKHIKGDLWELRVKFASDITRVFYFYLEAHKIILLHGFLKKTDQTPKRELETAMRRMAEYKERSDDHEF